MRRTPAETVRTKLEQGVAAIVENPAEILPPLLQLYDIEGSQGSSIDREAYRGRLLQSLRTLVQTLGVARDAGRLPAGPALGGPQSQSTSCDSSPPNSSRRR